MAEMLGPYEIGKVHQADCLEAMRLLPDGCVDAVVTDPPYMVNSKSDGMGKLSPWADMCNASMWFAAWLSEARRIARATWAFLNWRSLVTYQKASCDIGWPIESLLVWDKRWIGPGGTSGLRPSYEMVALWLSGGRVVDRGLPDVRACQWSSHKPNGHPAEKPVELLEWLIKAVDAHSVCDPFSGSASVGAACLRTGALFVSFELDSAWVKAGNERIARELVGLGEVAPSQAKSGQQVGIFAEVARG